MESLWKTKEMAETSKTKILGYILLGVMFCTILLWDIEILPADMRIIAGTQIPYVNDNITYWDYTISL
jgi:hypothetical protein